MNDLISKAEVLKHQHIRIGRDFDEAYRVACVDVETIKGLPTVDAVEVVRCKDCKWYDCNGFCDYYKRFKDKTEFCSVGERKTDNE